MISNDQKIDKEVIKNYSIVIKNIWFPSKKRVHQTHAWKIRMLLKLIRIKQILQILNKYLIFKAISYKRE